MQTAITRKHTLSTLLYLNPDLGNLVVSHFPDMVLKGHRPFSPKGTAGWRDGPISWTRRLRHREVK